MWSCHRIYARTRTLRSRRITCAILGWSVQNPYSNRLPSSSLSPAAAILHLLSHLYVQRCSPLWKEHASWFSEAISDAFSSLPKSLPQSNKREAFYALYEDRNLCYSVHRHIVVLDAPFRRLFSFIPREVLGGKSLACDPLPPPTSLSYYDEDFFRGVDDFSTEHRRRLVNRQVMQQHIPDEILHQHLQVRSKTSSNDRSVH
jgi:hypothetical protein